MSLVNLLGEVALESTQEQILGTIALLLAAMLEKMPRVTGNDQCAVSVESGSVGISGSVTNITGYLGDIRALGGSYASGANLMLSGTQHIYSNILVS